MTLPVLFAWKPGHPPHQWLVIVPLPFLLWSAVRFGPGALGLHLLVVVLVALLCTRAGRGPFATGSVAQIIVALQGFFLFISIPLMLLAALVWQHAQAAASLRRSEEGSSRARSRCGISCGTSRRPSRCSTATCATSSTVRAG